MRQFLGVIFGLVLSVCGVQAQTTETFLALNGTFVNPFLVAHTWTQLQTFNGGVAVTGTFTQPLTQFHVFQGGVSNTATDVALSTAIDAAIGSTRGSVLERGASTWGLFVPGTSGLPWVSNGGGADPSYGPVKDTSEVIGSPVSKWSPLWFGNGGSGVVHRFNRVFVGEATASSSDIGPVTTKDWLEILYSNTTGVAQFASVDTTGQLGAVGASRTGDFRTSFGSATGGAQGVSGFAQNNDNATSAASATVGAGGSGYTNGTQVLTVQGGTCAAQPTFNVTVSGNVVTAVVSVNFGGSCTVTPANPASTNGGGGSGATLNVTYAAGNPVAAGVFGIVLHNSNVTNGVSEAAEFTVASAQVVVDIEPATGVVAGNTFATNTSAGFAGFTQPVSAAHIIGPSATPAVFRKGVVCLTSGLDTSIGAGTGGVCHEMGRNQSVRWRNSTPTTDGEIWANATGLHANPGFPSAIPLTSGPGIAIPQASTRFFVNVQDNGGGEGSVIALCPRSGTFRNLYVQTNSNVGGAGQTAVFTWRVNAGGTAVTCTINSGANTCNDQTHSVACTPGQPYDLQAVLSATTGALIVAAGIEFDAQ